MVNASLRFEGAGCIHKRPVLSQYGVETSYTSEMLRA